MKYLENTIDVNLMVWETNPRMRNKNNRIKININDSINLEVGDTIIASFSQGTYSAYEVTDLISKRKSSLKNMEYYEVDFKPVGAMKGIVKTYEDNLKKEQEKAKKKIEKSIS